MSSPRNRRLKIGTLIALGGLLGAGVSDTYRLASAQEPCPKKHCHKILWIYLWCHNNDGKPTYCDKDSPEDTCVTRVCMEAWPSEVLLPERAADAMPPRFP